MRGFGSAKGRSRFSARARGTMGLLDVCDDGSEERLSEAI